MNYGNRGKGRKKGVPNRATLDARDAVGLFVKGNVGRLEGWLDQVSNGIPLLDDDGKQMRTEDHRLRWVLAPDPARAFDMVRDLLEYNIPKLARTELTGKDGSALTVTISDPTRG